MIINELRKVSCVMVTSGRPNLAKRAIQCYFDQNYRLRELIVLSQDEGKDYENLWSFVKHRDDVQLVQAPKDLCLGSLRNTSIELATSDIICQWDDDDFYDPLRLATQYRALVSKHNAVASLYTQFLKLFHLADRDMLFWTDWSKEWELSHRYLCGSIMFYKKWFHHYRNVFYPITGEQCEHEEDLNVLEKLLLHGEVVGVDKGHQYVYVYHGSNTYDLEHHKLSVDESKSMKELKIAAELQRQQSVIEGVLDRMVLTRPVEVRSAHSLVFTWHPHLR